MSVQATRWAWRQKVGSASAKLVLLALADKADERNCAWPTTDQLVEVTELNRKTVYSALSQLKSSGLIADSGARGDFPYCVTVYRLSFPEVAT